MTHTHSPRKSRHTELQKLNLAIVGLARNCEKTIRADIQRLKTSANNAMSIVWLVVESDSSDNTVGELQSLQSELENFQFASLGNLAETIPKRTDRISFCRNYYAEQIRTNNRFSNIDYVVVADLDGLNNKLTQKSFESCWERTDWDMCAANQDGPYYDIWALRHKEWCPEDCWAQHRFLNRYSRDFGKNLWESVYSKMITIPQASEWIEVDSAFGGLAIYRKKAFDVCEYVGITTSGEEFCEHVHFHQQLKSHGAKLYINPRLINASMTEHTIHCLPKIEYSYGSYSILLPADHMLPHYQKQHPKYDRFLPHLAKHLKNTELVVDIGANVGDTLAAMYQANENLRYICIEPDNVFFTYLSVNIGRIRGSGHRIDVTIINALVGKSLSVSSLKGSGGTKHAVIGDARSIPTKPLDRLIEQSQISSVRLLKSDVDGFDWDVLDSSTTVIQSSRPLIYFELQYNDESQYSGYLTSIDTLDKYGYTDWFVFDNFGSLLLKTEDINTVRQLMAYVSNQNIGKSTRTIHYFDILTVQKKDVDFVDFVLKSY